MTDAETTFELGDKLRLTPFRLADAEALFAVVDKNRDHLRARLDWVDDTKSVDDSRTYISAAIDQQQRGLGFHCGIWHGDLLAGTIGYHPIDRPNRGVALRYWLDEQQQGRGLVTRSARFVTKYAFDELRLHKVVIACATQNSRSRAIPERLGFVHEGTLRDQEWLCDHWVDHEIYGLLEDEYRAGQLG